jgi:hypothetical protein
MPVKTRSSNGRFAEGCIKSEDLLDNPLPITIHKITVIRILKILFLILVISPWILLAFRKNTVENISKKITDFYDDNFSCSSYCINESLYTNTTSSEKLKMNL